MLIGFNGKMKRGKDAACQFILEEYPGSRRDAFADRLKVSAARALGHKGTPEECIDFCNRLKQPGTVIEFFLGLGDSLIADPLPQFSGREYLQWYGTEAHREVFDTDFWISAVLDGYDIFDPDDKILVVTDVRFLNEAEAVRAVGGKIVHLVRPDLDEAEMGQEVHASEQVLAPKLIDHTIINDGSLSDLRDKVLEYVQFLHEPACSA